MRVEYVIPNYENPSLLDMCISSIRKYSDASIIVCDDNSSSVVLFDIRKVCKSYAKVKLLTNFWNSGFGHSCNLGMAASNADVVILTNSDIILTEDIEASTIEAFKKDRKLGIMGYLLMYPNGTIQHGGHFYPNDRHEYSGHRDYKLPLEQACEAKKSNYNISVTGALMAVRKRMFEKIGGFKRDYMFSCEDNEYCFRAWHTGYKVYYNADVSAIHAEGFTRGNNYQAKVQSKTYLKEKRTFQQYAADIQLYDFNEIDRQMNKAKGIAVEARPKRIGVIRAGALGDCILATGIINELKRRNPDSHIYVATLCPYPFAVNKNVEKVFHDPRKMVEQVDRVFNLDLAYEKKPLIPVTHAYAEVCFKSYRVKNIRPTIDSIPDIREKVKANIVKLVPDDKKIVVIHAGYGFWEMKHLDKEHWVKVAKYLVNKGYVPICVGANADYVIPDTVDLVGKMKLHEIFELINLSDLFVSCDGGIAHLASCTNTKMVTVYSVADPKSFVWRWDNTVIVEPNTECKYCRNKVEPPVTGVLCKHGDNRCIKSITADNIISGIKKIEGGDDDENNSETNKR